MDITFTQLFEQVCESKFNISKERVQKALAHPDAHEIINLEDLELGLFIKLEHILTTDTYLLVCARKDNANWLIDVAFMIPTDIVDRSRPLEPIIVLQQFVQKFGLAIRIGSQYNKFIFKELIRIDQQSEDIFKVVEIINPSNHNFIQQMFLKLEQDGERKNINCALAFCIDEDEYSSWLFGRRTGEVMVQIAPQIRGRITSRDLINANGTLTFNSNYSEIGEGKAGFLFKVVNDSYYFEVGFTVTHIYIVRNHDRLELPIQPIFKPTGHFFCAVTWSPTELSIILLDESYNDAISVLDSPIKKEEELERRKKVLKTLATIPPNSLVCWARNRSIAPTDTYESEGDFNEVVTSAIQSVQDKVSTLGVHNPFWDIFYEGSKIISRKPKRETDIHPTIHTLLYDISLAKSLQISTEHAIAGGQLDFLISGILSSGQIVNVCIEFKHAHSKDVFSGLLKQLPAYMQAKGCDFGLYCVMWFKGEDFSEPKEYDLHQLEMLLNGSSISAGLSNIRVILLDFSHKKPPSKL